MPDDPSSRPSYIGARLPRVEDERLAAGRHRYIGDMRMPGMVEMAVVRSPYAHALIRRVDVGPAMARPGVVAAISAADLADVSPVPDFFEWARPVSMFPLCRQQARYVGAPVAVVVASDRYLAEDAAPFVEVDYDELPVASTLAAALAPDAPGCTRTGRTTRSWTSRQRARRWRRRSSGLLGWWAVGTLPTGSPGFPWKPEDRSPDTRMVD